MISNNIKFSITKTDYKNYKADCVLLFSSMDDKLGLLTKYKNIISFDNKLGATLFLPFPDGILAKSVIIVGLGKNKIPSIKDYLKALTNAILLVKKHNISTLLIPYTKTNNNDINQDLQNSVNTIVNSLYKINKPYVKDSDNKLKLKQVVFSITTKNNINIDSINNGLAIANGATLSKNLANLPSNICTPSYLANTAQDIAKKYNIKCEILNTKDMQKLGMNSLLSVAKGSCEEPKLITLQYNNNASAKPVVLIGKGVTFDSGGISIKPSADMDEMKYDMCGASSVLGVMLAVLQMQLKINLIVIAPSVENMPSSKASKPGDIVQSMSGQTIEILNTDAEGRMILCDAISYAKQFKPQVVIDVATLTGAVIIALGRKHTGFMTNYQQLADKLKVAGKLVNDTIWQMPLDEEYDELLISNFADMANIGGREAGSITAGCFLARFAKDINWGHLDIAGTAWNTGKNKGATGRPVALLAQYLLSKSKVG